MKKLFVLATAITLVFCTSCNKDFSVGISLSFGNGYNSQTGFYEQWHMISNPFVSGVYTNQVTVVHEAAELDQYGNVIKWRVLQTADAYVNDNSVKEQIVGAFAGAQFGRVAVMFYDGTNVISGIIPVFYFSDPKKTDEKKEIK